MHRANGHPPHPFAFYMFVFATLVLFYLCGFAQSAQSRLERQTYVAYRTPHLCSYHIMEAVNCGDDKPMCCVASSAIRCCDRTTSCGNCTDDIVGYEMPKSSVILGCFSLSVLVLLGSIIMSGVGRHFAWVLERRRVIENYRKRLVLRRAEAREFKKELAETEEKDVEDSVACVICCARHIDVALTPCGHVCCCRFCAKRLKECPVCRAAVQRCFDLPLYYVKQLVKAADEECEGEAEVNLPTATTTTAAAAAVSPTMTASTETAVKEEVEEEETSAVQTPQRRSGSSCGETKKAHERGRLSGSSACAETLLQQSSEDANNATATWEEEEENAATAASFMRFNPFRGNRYTRLDNDQSAEGAAAVSEATTHAAALPSASPRAVVVVVDAHETKTASSHRDGFIAVEK